MSEKKTVLSKEQGDHLFGSDELSGQAARAATKVATRNLLDRHQCRVLVDLYNQKGVSEGGVARRSISRIEDDYDDLIKEAILMNYPAFVMGDQIVVFFTNHGDVKQVAGPDVKRK